MTPPFLSPRRVKGLRASFPSPLRTGPVAANEMTCPLFLPLYPFGIDLFPFPPFPRHRRKQPEGSLFPFPLGQPNYPLRDTASRILSLFPLVGGRKKGDSSGPSQTAAFFKRQMGHPFFSLPLYIRRPTVRPSARKRTPILPYPSLGGKINPKQSYGFPLFLLPFFFPLSCGEEGSRRGLTFFFDRNERTRRGNASCFFPLFPWSRTRRLHFPLPVEAEEITTC